MILVISPIGRDGHPQQGGSVKQALPQTPNWSQWEPQAGLRESEKTRGTMKLLITVGTPALASSMTDTAKEQKEPHQLPSHLAEKEEVGKALKSWESHCP
jgi:hypothetical protein